MLPVVLLAMPACMLIVIYVVVSAVGTELIAIAVITVVLLVEGIILLRICYSIDN